MSGGRVKAVLAVAAAGALLTGCASTGSSTTAARHAALVAAQVQEKRDTGPAAEAQNTQTVRRMWDVVFSRHRMDLAGDFITQDYIQHTPSVPEGLFGFKLFYQQVFFKMFPDTTATIDEIVAQNDKVVAFGTWRGHQAGTGKALLLHTADVYRFVAGKAAEHWDVIDYSVLKQFGYPPPVADQPATTIDQAGSAAQSANLRLAQDFADVVYRQRQVDRAGEFVAPDLLQHDSTVAPGLAGFKAHLQRDLAMFPDLKYQLVHVIAGDDRVVVFWTWTGHQAGTGKALHLHSADMYRVANGKLAEHWDTVDLAALQQFDTNSGV